MKNKQMVGTLGIILLIFGVFAPLIHMPIVGSLTYISRGQGDGIIILLIAVISAYYLYKENYKNVRYSGMISILILLFTFFMLEQKITEIKNQMNMQLAGNPFRGLADVAVNSIYFEWGFGILLIGCSSHSIRTASRKSFEQV